MRRGDPDLFTNHMPRAFQPPMRHVETDHVVQNRKLERKSRSFRRSTTWQGRVSFVLHDPRGFAKPILKVAADRQGPRFMKCGRRHSSRWKRREPSRDARERLALALVKVDRTGPNSSANQTKAIAANQQSPDISTASRASRAIKGGMGARCTSIHPKSAMCKIKARETIDLTIGPSVELHPVLPTTSAKSLAAPIVADARVRKNAE